jgi:RNA polymerase sigma factor (sigma-70 family)
MHGRGESASVEKRVDQDALSDAFPQDRDRLVRLCARLSGNAGAAEDLAQEALMEAWRSRDSLRDPARREAWLSGIAHNVCLRWARRSGREGSRRVDPADHETPVTMDAWLADDFDLEIDLERRELAGLLDRAMEYLPPETRLALIRSYIEERPQAEVASGLGLSEGALRVRLHRGKLALHRILSTSLSNEAAAYGLMLPGGGWQETGLWCFGCGRHLLQGSFDAGTNAVIIRCPSCSADGMNISQGTSAERPGRFKGFKRFLERQMLHVESESRRALELGHGGCPWCGHVNPVHMVLSEDAPAPARGLSGLHMQCSSCGAISNQLLAGLALAHPEVQRFQIDQGRIGLRNERQADIDGLPSIVTTFESLTGAARIDVLSAADGFKVLSVVGPKGMTSTVTSPKAL